MKPLRILHVLPRSEGGIGKHVAQLASAFEDRAGMIVDIGCPSGTAIGIQTNSRLGERGRATTPFEIPIPDGLAGGHLRAALRIRSLVRRNGYRVVHAHGLRASIDAAAGVAGLGVPTVTTVHNLIRPEIAGRRRAHLYRRAEGLAVRVSTRTLAASEQIAEHLARSGKGKASRIEVLYVPADPPSVTRNRVAARREIGVDDAIPLIATTARLAPQKALHVMLDAVSLLEKATLAVIGDGPLRAALESRAAALGISERVMFLGFRHDVDDIVAAADAFCLSSVWEAIALAAQEAVLLETPVASTDAGGMRELIEDGISGRLVPVGDAQALAAALEEVLDPTTGGAYAARALADYRKRFSPEATVARLGEIYRKLAGE